MNLQKLDYETASYLVANNRHLIKKYDGFYAQELLIVKNENEHSWHIEVVVMNDGQWQSYSRELEQFCKAYNQDITFPDF